jgi:hypothetical protein
VVKLFSSDTSQAIMLAASFTSGICRGDLRQHVADMPLADRRAWRAVAGVTQFTACFS